jgi:hypothetical protein
MSHQTVGLAQARPNNPMEDFMDFCVYIPLVTKSYIEYLQALQ